MTDSEQIRHLFGSNKEQIALFSSAGATLGYKIDENNLSKLCMRMQQYAPVRCKLYFDLLTLKVVSESSSTWATSVPILVFLGLSVLEISPMYATDRQTSDAHHRLMPLL